MWLWQPRQRKLWTRLLFCSCWLHGILCVLLFVVYHGSQVDVHVIVSKPSPDSQVQIRFVPLAKSIKQRKQVGKSGVQKKQAQKKQKKQVIQKKVSKPVVKKTSKSPAKLPLPLRQGYAGQVDKLGANGVGKKAAVIKQAVKPAEKPKPLLQPSPVRPEFIEGGIEERASAQEIKQEVVPEKEVVKNEPEKESVQDDPEILYIGQAERDAILMQELIQQEIEERWRPPVGLSKELVCDIKVVVGWNGKAERVEIEKASGVLVYDIQARATVLAMNFPKLACGKQLCMHFKQ